ncbi:BlaI/MecI/CopY family transcriptional regulator [Acidicapsa dinghuensis]|uniref:BlaI/MecI/CopY family transcriptional regulator n=1 Tax=Acidicapsa dinghuensis TaxID=2218256 RepID=A0ABW1EGE8_9BACT|nr:BlaI/MecI/CopY family transcriptional regulator [Acidicapsa dinghuensis]
MAAVRLTKFEMEIMEALWAKGEASIREIQESLQGRKRPGYTTVQKMVYRLEEKKVLRRVRKVGNFHLFAATLTRKSAQRRWVNDLLAIFGGESRPVMAHLIGAGKLTLEDIEFAEQALKKANLGGKEE